MDSLFFLLATIGLAVVVHWAWKNDKVPLDAKTSGFLAMREFGPKASNPDKRKISRSHPRENFRRIS